MKSAAGPVLELHQGGRRLLPGANPSPTPPKSFAWAYHGRITDDGDFGPGSAWCNSAGDWGLEDTVSNHSIWCHQYKAGFDFGTTQGGNFVVFEHVETSDVQLCGHHDQNVVRGNGHSNKIRDNFAAIGAGREWCYQEN
jgi:hypothetical protein